MDNSKPIILLLGEIVLAHKEWDALRAIAELRQVSEGPRDQFLRDLKNGVYEGVIAIARTWDSTEFTGRFDQTIVSLLPDTVKFISHNGAGYDSIDAAACAERGISVSNTPGAVDASTASIAIWLMLGALRRAHIPYTATRAGKWRGRMQLTHDPENKLLGILGMGGIGTSVAKRAGPFGMSIQYHNRHEVSKEKNSVGAKYVGFEELLRTSDVISVHLPLNVCTRGIIGRKELAMMKDGVVIVNTARGPIVDEAALVEALESGKVWGAGLDVYEREPIVDEGLLRNDHCVLMPHVGTASFETQRKMEELVIKNLESVITNGRLLTPVAECQVLTMALAAKTETKTNGVSITEQTATPAASTYQIRGRRGTETETLAEKIKRPTAVPLDATQQQLKKNSNTNSNNGGTELKTAPKTNGVASHTTTTTTTTTTEGLWEPPSQIPLKRTDTNWLEIYPPMVPQQQPAKENNHDVIEIQQQGHSAKQNGIGNGIGEHAAVIPGGLVNGVGGGGRDAGVVEGVGAGGAR